jgi:hypothetical protein
MPNDDKPDMSVALTAAESALAAARARIAQIPAGATLIDRLDSARWQAGEEGSVEAGRREETQTGRV